MRNENAMIDELLKQEYVNRDLRLFPGEEWLPTERESMSWYEAVYMTEQDPTLRLPDYSELIWAQARAKENPELQKQFPLLESISDQRSEFWSFSSEGGDANSKFACWVTADHEHYTSHNSKQLMRNVRFIRRKVT